MGNASTLSSIDENLSARGGKEDRDPVRPPPGEANVLKNFQKKWPGDGVESLGDIDLHQDRRAATAVEPATGELDCHEVVMDGSSPDEGALVAA